MIAAGYQSISSCQSQRQPALQAGQARQQVGRGSAAIHTAAFRLSHPRGGETFLMLRNKEPELAENIDSSFGWFELGCYRVSFVFGSWSLILVRANIFDSPSASPASNWAK